MTTRTRKQQRAKQLRDWADKREQKAAGEFAGADALAERFPMGQPILVGHHSEAGARRDQDRITQKMRRGIDDQAKAEDMRQRAENIEREAARAIYADDPDAAESLAGKVSALEAERARIAAYNASCRKALKANPDSLNGDLSLLDDRQRHDLLAVMKTCPYQVRAGGQFPAYVSSNLSGRIAQAKKRLEGMA
jgi:hypothetical protein